MVKAPLTVDATVQSVEAFLAEQYERREIALAMAQDCVDMDWRERWLNRLRIILIVEVIVLVALVGARG